MKAAKWREFSTDELQQKARELTEEIFNLRFQLSMGMAKNPSRLSQAKKDLARASTVLREKKGVRASKKLKAHDETNESRVGDRVLIEETRPLSKEKRWRIRKVLSRVS